MQISEIKNNKTVAGLADKLIAFQGAVFAGIIVVAFLVYGYLFSGRYLSLSSPIPGRAVALSSDLQLLQSKLGLSFEGAEILRKNTSELDDYTEAVVGGVRGRSNPFDSYASSRPTR